METSRIPRVVWLLGLVSLCMDLSSEMIHSLLPVFLVSTLGASTITLGLIEGVAEGTASIAKVFSGVLSDRFGRRKPLVVLGYGLAAVSKPLFPLANSAGWVLFARFADRIGKGIRGAPRCAIGRRDAAGNPRRRLRTAASARHDRHTVGTAGSDRTDERVGRQRAGGLLGRRFAGRRGRVALVIGVDEPSRHADQRSPSALPSSRDVHALGTPFWIVVVIGAIFTLARFSEAFLVVRAYDLGLSLNWTPLALAVMNLTYVASAYPAGRLSDRIGRVGLLMIGLVILVVADFVLIAATSLNGVLLGIALWGLHMGVTQGLLSALVADTAPADLRGSAFGVFYFVSGIGAVVASLLAGGLWKLLGPQYTFGAGAIFATFALGALLWRRFRHGER